MQNILLLGVLWFSCTNVHGALQLASIFGSHMVLQRAPQSAVLWGTATVEGDKVTVHVTGTGANIAPVITTVAHGAWKLKLPPVAAGGPYVIDVTSSEGHVTLSDVLFGDVWLCSGQSNMHFMMNQVMNSTAELQKARTFPNIRFTRARGALSDTPRNSMSFDVPWSGPDPAHLQNVSAVCWLFAEYLYPHVSHPLGLIDSSWGGTPIEAWSPTEAIQECAHITKRDTGNDTIFWNAMINPLLGTTLFGVLWYQGESNAAHPSKYSCQIQAMLKHWRHLFNVHSFGQTASDFPFGYVQLAPTTKGDWVGSYTPERWAQTAGYGYSPNPALPKTFMAVAMDLPDFTSPYGAGHPRFKQDIAERLMLGALNVAYGHTDVVFQGPFPTNFQLDATHHTLTVEYDHGRTPLDVRNNKGFEVCCSSATATVCNESHDHWVAAPITQHNTGHVTVSTSSCGTSKVTGLRYEWRSTPCDYKMCAIYGAESGLPAPLYITHTLPR